MDRLKAGLGEFADLKGDLAKEGVVFLRWGGIETSMHNNLEEPSY